MRLRRAALALLVSCGAARAQLPVAEPVVIAGTAWARVWRLDGGWSLLPLGRRCARCLPSFAATAPGPFPWGTWSAAPSVRWQVGLCEMGLDGVCSETVQPALRCRAALDIVVALASGYHALDHGVGLPIVGGWHAVLEAHRCGGSAGWWADIYRTGVPHQLVARIVAVAECSICQ